MPWIAALAFRRKTMTHTLSPAAVRLAARYLGEAPAADSSLAERLATRVLAARLVKANEKVLNGHVSEATAYVVDDYPYGFKLRTSIRYWIDTAPKKGSRFVSQTKDPKTGRWNKPKASTYDLLGGVMYLDGKNHVQWDGLGPYSSAKQVLDFVQKYPHADMPLLKTWVKMKLAHLFALIEGRARYITKVNGVEQTQTQAQKDEDIGRWQDEAEQWHEASTYIRLTCLVQGPYAEPSAQSGLRSFSPAPPRCVHALASLPGPLCSWVFPCWPH